MLCLPPSPSCRMTLKSQDKIVGYAVLSGIATEVNPNTGSFTLNSIMSIGVSTSSALRYDGMHAGCHSTGSFSPCVVATHAPCQLTWQPRPPTKAQPDRARLSPPAPPSRRLLVTSWRAPP